MAGKMARKSLVVLAFMAAFVWGSALILKSEASVPSVHSRVVVNFTDAPIINSWAAGSPVGQDAIYGQESTPAASHVVFDHVCRVPSLPAGGTCDRSTGLPPLLGRSAWVGAISVTSAKEWYAADIASIPNWVFPDVSAQSSAQELAMTIAGDKGDAHIRPRSHRPSKELLKTSAMKLRPSQMASQSLMALQGAVVTGSTVGVVFFTLVGTGVHAAGGWGSTDEHAKGTDRTQSTYLLKILFLTAIIPVLLFGVFGLRARGLLLILAAAEGFRLVAPRLVELVLVPFLRSVFCAEPDSQFLPAAYRRHAIRIGEYICSWPVEGETS